jgi:hypothetical protein
MAIRTRILAGFSTVLLLIGAVAAVGWSGFRSFAARVDTAKMAAAVRESVLTARLAADRIRLEPAALEAALDALGQATATLRRLEGLAGAEAASGIRAAGEATERLAGTLADLATSQSAIREARAELNQRIEDFTRRTEALGTAALARYTASLETQEARRAAQLAANGTLLAAQRLALLLSELAEAEAKLVAEGRATDREAAERAGAAVSAALDGFLASVSEAARPAAARIVEQAQELHDGLASLVEAAEERSRFALALAAFRPRLAEAWSEVEVALLALAGEAGSEGLRRLARAMEGQLPSLRAGAASRAESLVAAAELAAPLVAEAARRPGEADRINGLLRRFAAAATGQAALERSAAEAAARPGSLLATRRQGAGVLMADIAALLDEVRATIPGFVEGAVAARTDFERHAAIRDIAGRLTAQALRAQLHTNAFALAGQAEEAAEVRRALGAAETLFTTLLGAVEPEERLALGSLAGAIAGAGQAFEEATLATAGRARHEAAMQEATATADREMTQLSTAQGEALAAGRPIRSG